MSAARSWHSYASMLVNAGHSLYEVQQALGRIDDHLAGVQVDHGSHRLDPSIDPDEWLSRDLAAAVEDCTVLSIHSTQSYANAFALCDTVDAIARTA